VLHGGRQGAIADKVYLLVSGACDLEKSVVFARKRVGADGAQTTERHSRVVPVSTLRVCPPAERQTNKQANKQTTPASENKQTTQASKNKQTTQASGRIAACGRSRAGAVLAGTAERALSAV
jgi:hypothetical protein